MTAAQLLELRALADAAALHVEPWADDGQGGYQCANCQRDMWLRSSEYEPRGLCEECIDTALAAARSAVPALLDRVAELEAGLREALAIAHEGWGNVDDYFRDKYLDPERLAALAALVTK